MVTNLVTRQHNEKMHQGQPSIKSLDASTFYEKASNWTWASDPFLTMEVKTEYILLETGYVSWTTSLVNTTENSVK
jgi:hypothetical protein